MSNPVYTGVLWRGKKNPVDLTDFYDFKPMVTVEEFMQINNLTEKGFGELSNKFYKEHKVKADLLRGRVICNECGQSMTCGLTSKVLVKEGKVHYYNFRCDTDGCSCSGSSTRANVIIDHARKYLESKPFSSKKSYESYRKEMKRVSDYRLTEAKAELRTLQAKLNSAIEKHTKTKHCYLTVTRN